MRLKVHQPHIHLHKFPENLGDLSEEQEERFHQDIKMMEEKYQGKWGQTYHDILTLAILTYGTFNMIILLLTHIITQKRNKKQFSG